MDFNLLRLLMASSVAVSHYRAITGGDGWTLPSISSTVAVQAFFVISGWIVTASYLSSRSMSAFYVRRFARLVPLYVVVVLLQAAIVLAMVPGARDVSRDVIGYLAANLAFANFLRPSLLGFLDGAPVQAINPSLWTLKIEVMYYASVPLWVMLARRFGWKGLLSIFVLSTLYVHLVTPVSGELAKQLPGQMRFFVAGMACRELFARRHAIASRLPAWTSGAAGRVAVTVTALCALALAQWFDESASMAFLQPVWVALFVAAAAQTLPSIATLPDISYGVYLLHAPLFQFSRALDWLPGGAAGFAVGFAACVVLATVAAYVVEKPAIRAGHRWSQRLGTARPATGSVVA